MRCPMDRQKWRRGPEEERVGESVSGSSDASRVRRTCPPARRFTAEEVIGYIRVCRPGSVIGPQQNFLRDVEARMWHEGDIWRAARGINKPHLALEVRRPAAPQPRLRCDTDLQWSRLRTQKPETP